MKQILLILLITFFSVLSINAQEVVMDIDVEEQYSSTHGPNMRHYGHIYMGFGLILDFDEEHGAAINPWRSSNFTFGYRYKLKLLSFYAIGLDLNFRIDDYFMEDDEKNPLDGDNPLTFITGEEKHILTNN